MWKWLKVCIENVKGESDKNLKINMRNKQILLIYYSGLWSVAEEALTCEGNGKSRIFSTQSDRLV